MVYEAVALPRMLRNLPVSELKKHYRQEETWDVLQEGQRIPMQVERLEALSETALIDGKLNDRDLRRINRALDRDGLFIGRDFVVRTIEGAKVQPY